MTKFLFFTLILICLLAAGFLLWAAGGNRDAALTVSSTPARASVWVDGRYLGATPVTRSDLLPGDHVLRVVRFGHRPVLRQVRLMAGPNQEQFTLAALVGGTLSVTSDPAGAEVSFNGEPAGVTPLTLRGLGPGGYPVRLSLVNFMDWTGTADIEESRTAEIKVALKLRTEVQLLDEIKRRPKDAAPYTDLAHYCILRGEWEKAEDAFAQALVLCARENESAYYASRLTQEIEKVFHSGFNYNDVPRGQQAIVNAYVRACRDYPAYSSYYSAGLRYAAERNMADKSQEIVEIGLVSLPYDTSWITQSVSGRYGDGSTDRWIERLTAQIKKEPNDFVMRVQRAVLYQQKGDSALAVADFEEAAKKAKAPGAQAKLRETCGRLYDRLKDYDKSAASYAAAAKVEPVKKNRTPVFYNLARVLTLANRPDDAHAAWKDAVDNQEDVETACRWRLEWAQFNVNAGKPDRARTTLEETLRLTHDGDTRSRAQALLDQVKPK